MCYNDIRCNEYMEGRTARVYRYLAQDCAGAFFGGESCYLQVRVAGVNPWPRIVQLLLIVAAPAVEPRQVAVTLFPGCACMVVRLTFTGSEVDHTPSESAIIGQFPVAFDERRNWASLPGGAAVWSAVAVEGVTFAVIAQLLVVVPQPASSSETVIRRAGTVRSGRRREDIGHRLSGSGDYMPRLWVWLLAEAAGLRCPRQRA